MFHKKTPASDILRYRVLKIDLKIAGEQRTVSIDYQRICDDIPDEYVIMVERAFLSVHNLKSDGNHPTETKYGVFRRGKNQAQRRINF